MLSVLAFLAVAAPLAGTGPAGDPAAFSLGAGRRALGEKEHALAAEHFRHALVHAPGSLEILELLLDASEGDADARALWSEEWALAALGADGKLPVQLPAAVQEEAWAGRLALARHAAFDELRELAVDRQKKGARASEELLVARWAARAARDLARGSPALEARASALSPELVLSGGFHEPVLRALQQALTAALAGRRYGEAVRVARCLTGLATQAGFGDLQGEKPGDLTRIRETAADGLARAREALAAQSEPPWTVDELEWLTEEQGEAFTREHASFAGPGVALSPRGWYRVETDCGQQTLCGVARTVEDHHRRLANWYGRDPFVGSAGAVQPGTVRVVHEAGDLESEGAPYFWAGGFQSGDLTVARLACGTIEGFGHLLTHELTHRFDGAIHPGQPAWLAEGKAVWTGAAYGHSSDERFVEAHALFGTVEAAFVEGYGAPDNLRKLVSGTVADYRDNYVAGYALYLYLNTWKEGERLLYRERLRAFMESGRASKLTQEERFVAHFCDGVEDRPADLDAFAARFGEYISGFYWKTPKPWTQWYTGNAPGKGDGWVYDEPTWTWSRERAEPVFGEAQAARAGELLVELGEKNDAVRALVWALAADGASPPTEAELARVLVSSAQKAAAWTLEHARAFPNERTSAVPFLASLARTRALITGYEESAREVELRGAAGAATALRAERDRIAAWVGIEPLAPAMPAATGSRHPFDRPARHLGYAGWEESGLTGYEERRVPGLWYADEDGDVHVGRERSTELAKPRTGTTEHFDRAAHQRHACVLSKDWIAPGAWRFRAIVQFTTSFASGSLVFGYTRRDRNLRVDFSAGDFMYAIGESEQEPTFESVSWGLRGLFLREGPLTGSHSGGTLAFAEPRTSFEVEIVVDGATAHLLLDGRRVATYHTVDGVPIEGRIGFATGMGAIRVRAPTIQRLDRSAAVGWVERVPIGLDLARGRSCSFAELQNRDVSGLPPSINGTVCLWIPGPWSQEDATATGADWVEATQRSVARIASLLDRRGAPQPLVVVVPSAMGDGAVDALRRALAGEPGSGMQVVEHALAPLAGENGPTSPDLDRRWILFVDPAGVARVILPYFSGSDGAFEESLAHWVRVFQDHGRPPRELEPPERGAGEEPLDGGDR